MPKITKCGAYNTIFECENLYNMGCRWDVLNNKCTVNTASIYIQLLFYIKASPTSED